jgi:uncharacterized repeat protein (TIGR04138 family)
LASQTPYSEEAFFFLLSTLQTAFTGTHITAEELCGKLRDHACAVFGRGAQNQLNDWGIRTTEDFGAMMYALIGAGLAGKRDVDRIEQFCNVFQFDVAFADCRRKSLNQFTLPFLFLVTTVAAIFFVGLKSIGIQGGLVAVFSSWIAFIGGFCLHSGLRESSRVRLLSVTIGILFLIIGAGAFFVIASK